MWMTKIPLKNRGVLEFWVRVQSGDKLLKSFSNLIDVIKWQNFAICYLEKGLKGLLKWNIWLNVK